MTSAKRLIFILKVLFLASCASNLKYTDFAMSDDLVPGYTSPEFLSESDLEYDKKMIIQALDRVYGGRFVINKSILDQTKLNIRKIKGPISTKGFCDLIGAEFDKVPDYHLHVRHNNKKCTKIERKEAKIGRSLSVKNNKLWVVRKMNKKNKKVLYISIKEFPSHISPKWHGFLDKVSSLTSWSDIVVFDLRGNTGGDDTIGYRLSQYFHKEKGGFKFPTPYSQQITSQTPESLILKISAAKYFKRAGYGDSVHLTQWELESKNTLVSVLKGKLEKVKKSEPAKIDSDWKFSGFKLPIYILMDENCYSSCESTIDAFEHNPYVKKVGRHTAGMLHFGNVVPLILKNSMLYVQIPTHANLYRDGRFIEKKGIAPDIKVPNGKDALDYLFNIVL